jgi:hypothetical protein
MALPEVNCAELSVQLGAGFSLLYISNIEYRTRNFEQQKFLKGVRQCFSLRYSAVPCSAVLRFIFSNNVLLRVFPRHRHATLGYIWSIDSIGVTTLIYNFKISIGMAQSLLISKDVEVGR